jgi:glycosyltransferase involved in cell wall biosynthesis
MVSVVIPTRGRPQEVVFAVESALAQSHASLEVIVVVDGPEWETARALQAFRDVRLRWIVLDENAGGAEARNVGVRAARGEWVAFLDDDDTWMREKLERQTAIASAMRVSYPVVSSRLLENRVGGGSLLPRRLYTAGKDVSEYLFCRQGFSYGDGMLQTSTLLVKRSLLIDTPFRKGLQRHQDWDWLLRVASRPDVEIAMLPEPLTVMRVDEQGKSVSQAVDWEASFAWGEQARSLMRGRAYSFFIATECVPRARRSGARIGVMLRLFRAYLWGGEPGVRSMALFLCFCLAPRKILKIWQHRTRRPFSMREVEAMTEL